MGCEPKEGGGFYHTRQPQQTPFYRLVERFYPQFEAAYEKRFQERYGYWRAAISTAVEKFLECGDLQQGFARVRCPECAHEFFVAYSCRGRCFCPSCHQKRALQTALWVSQEVCAAVPHRQFVFTIPKRLRIYFRFDRRLLGELCRVAWQVVRQVYAVAGDQPDIISLDRASVSFNGPATGKNTFPPVFWSHPKSSTRPILSQGEIRQIRLWASLANCFLISLRR